MNKGQNIIILVVSIQNINNKIYFTIDYFNKLFL